VRCHRHRVTDGVDEFAASRVVLVGVGVAIRFFFFFAHPRCWCERLLFSISVSLYVIEKNELKIKNGTSFFCSRASTPASTYVHRSLALPSRMPSAPHSP
jgi:hypothetical protein